MFDHTYKLKPLAEVAKYIEAHKHLPDVPPANKVAEKGIDLGEMDAILLRKIEEISLYLIEQQKQLDQLKAEDESLKREIAVIIAF